MSWRFKDDAGGDTILEKYNARINITFQVSDFRQASSVL